LDRPKPPSRRAWRQEELARSFCLMRGSTELVLQKPAIFTFAADHRISQAGVSAYPRQVTAQMVFNFLRGGAAINVLCRHYGIQNLVVDVGVDYDFPELPGLVRRKIARGTQNFHEAPAMSEEEAIQSIETGIS